ncbi:Fungalysin metallopeptidase-domain-containing protein [Syncephalis fuscata]|nr:Fungalysin metallopeptidase-domain-containing protein [Syncephalis fuscata]
MISYKQCNLLGHISTGYFWLFVLFLRVFSVSAQLESFSPSVPVVFDVLPRIGTCLFTSTASDPVEIARSFLFEHYCLKDTDYIIKNQYRSSSMGVTHIYIKQLVDQLPVINGDAGIHINDTGCMVAFSNSFNLPERHSCTETNEPTAVAMHVNDNNTPIAKLTPIDKIVSPYQALGALAKLFNSQMPLKAMLLHVLPVDSPSNVTNVAAQFNTTELRDIPFASGPVQVSAAGLHGDSDDDTINHILPVWSYRVATANGHYHVQIAMDGSRVLAISNWQYHASLSNAYCVIPALSQDPRPDLRTLVINPANQVSSPHGWHQQEYDGGFHNFTVTIGNNVYAQENLANRSAAEQTKDLLAAGHRPDGGDNLVFDFAFNATADDPTINQNASVTNVFYLINYLHDLFYQYGFNEVAGNFQESNWEKGGLGNDALLANTQDTGATNNADIIVPPDGERPRMRIHFYNYTQPLKDGGFLNDVVAHEYTHGLTARLTGGPANSDCLAEGEGLGMAEGWSDFVAIWLEATASVSPSGTTSTSPIRHAPGHGLNVGTYANSRGLRLYDYSTDLLYNPLNYALMNETYWQQPHNTGMIWCEMLYEMYWQLVDDTLGVTDQVDSPDLQWGNTLALQLVIDGLKLQPCRPTFLSARDAILLAEQLLTHGLHRCAIWRAFSKRGLGVNALPTTSNSANIACNALPDDCTHT